jgi:taurine--2-oxoglutarate transaminase
MNANVAAFYPTTHAVDNRYVHRLDRQYVAHSWAQQGSLDPMVITGAEECRVWDYAGQSYLDFSSQLVNAHFSHQHPKVVSAPQRSTQNWQC